MLEVGDVVGPLVLAVLKQARVIVSWLLVAIIGQAVGLVYRGVRQSMGGDGNAAPKGPWWWGGGNDAQMMVKRQETFV